jgi:predicted acyl esterase
MLIADYHRRASFREGLNLPPKALAPGEIAEMTFRVGWMSQIFAAGHRIRVTVSCTGLPLYETGGNGTDEGAGRTTHSLLHGVVYPSHVLAPVLGAEARIDVSEAFVAELATGVFPA